MLMLNGSNTQVLGKIRKFPSLVLVIIIALALMTMYLSSLTLMSIVGQFGTFVMIFFWILILFCFMFRMLLAFIRSRPESNIKPATHLFTKRSLISNVGIPLFALVIIYSGILTDIRFELSKDDLKQHVTKYLKSPGTVYVSKRIGILDVMAII